MRSFRIGTFFGRRLSARLLGATICLFTFALPLLANTPSLLRSVPSGGCYCHCAQSKVRGGCVKMCGSKQFAFRSKVVSCAKPHMSTPLHDSHAGPRFPHPGRAEHAEVRP